MEGVIGTIIGAILTLVITEIKRFHGKVNINTLDYKISYIIRNSDGMGGFIYDETENIEEANMFKYRIPIVFYNNSEVLKNLYSIKLKFIGSTGEEYIHTPFDKATKKVVGPCKNFDRVGIVNLEPHKLVAIDLFGDILSDEWVKFKELGGIKSIYVIGLNHKHKNYKMKIV